MSTPSLGKVTRLENAIVWTGRQIPGTADYAVTDAITFGQDWDGDTRIVLIITLGTGYALDDDLRARIKTAIRTRCSPRHLPAVIATASSVPRTRTGKLSEVAVRNAVNGRPVKGREALGNPDSLDEIAALPELRR